MHLTSLGFWGSTLQAPKSTLRLQHCQDHHAEIVLRQSFINTNTVFTRSSAYPRICISMNDEILYYLPSGAVGAAIATSPLPETYKFFFAARLTSSAVLLWPLHPPQRWRPYPIHAHGDSVRPASSHPTRPSSSDRHRDRGRPGRSATPQSPEWPESLRRNGWLWPHQPTSAPTNYQWPRWPTTSRRSGPSAPCPT